MKDEVWTMVEPKYFNVNPDKAIKITDGLCLLMDAETLMRLISDFHKLRETFSIEISSEYDFFRVYFKRKDYEYWMR